MCFLFQRERAQNKATTERYRAAAKAAMASLSDDYNYTLDVQGKTFKASHIPTNFSVSVNADNTQDYWLGVVAALARLEAKATPKVQFSL